MSAAVLDKPTVCPAGVIMTPGELCKPTLWCAAAGFVQTEGNLCGAESSCFCTVQLYLSELPRVHLSGTLWSLHVCMLCCCCCIRTEYVVCVCVLPKLCLTPALCPAQCAFALAQCLVLNQHLAAVPVCFAHTCTCHQATGT